MDSLFAFTFACLLVVGNTAPTPESNTDEEKKQPGDLVLRDWIVIATCRAACFKQFVSFPPSDNKCVQADGCLECWSACQDTYFLTGYEELCEENIGGKCAKGCEAACHFYDVLWAESVVPSPLWQFSEPAECDSTDPEKIDLSWTNPHPATGQKVPDTYLLYVLFVINDEETEWKKLAMTSEKHLQVSGDHKQYETLRFMILVVTPVGAVSSTYPEYQRHVETSTTTTTTAATTTTPEPTTTSTTRGTTTMTAFTVTETTQEASTSTDFSETESPTGEYIQEESSWQLDDAQLVIIIIASCTSLTVALVVVTCVISCYWCFCRPKNSTHCQTCYLRASLVDLQSFPSSKTSADNLYRNMMYSTPEAATLLPHGQTTEPGSQNVSPHYAPLLITALTAASAPLMVPDLPEIHLSPVAPESPVPTTIQIDGVWSESHV